VLITRAGRNSCPNASALAAAAAAASTVNQTLRFELEAGALFTSTPRQ
jgi:hypothetical protein